VRRAIPALLLVVALVGCVESDPSTVDVPGTTTTTPSIGAAPTVPAPTPGRAPVTTAPRSRRTIVVGGAEPGTRATTTAPSPVPVRAAGGPGSIADQILGTRGPARLAVQVLTQSGAEPHGTTLDRLVQVLEDVSGKPVRTFGGTVPVRSTWGSELRTAADAQAVDPGPDTLVLRFLFVHGQSDQGPDILGISVRGDVAAVFVDQVDQSATGLVPPATIEKAVAVHELGHLLGLVDLFRHTGRADPGHPGHSTNARSVMYWAVESSLVGDLLTGGPPQDFDPADLADLAAIRRG
jgi:hypothetical protein